MNVELFNPLRWNKKILLGLLGLVIVIWFVFIDVYSLKTRWELGQQKKELTEADAKYRQKINANTTRINNEIAAKNAEVEQLDKDYEVARRGLQQQITEQ